jgi:hypothetical protein
MDNCFEVSRAGAVDFRTRVDGVSVTDLFDTVYGQTHEISERFAKPLQFEVIAWSDLTIAAEAGSFSAELVLAIRKCLACEDARRVTVRAYPCHDDVWAIFDVQTDIRNDGTYSGHAWKPTMESLRKAVVQMGGEWEPIAAYADCRRMTFRLPQWIARSQEPVRWMRQAS